MSSITARLAALGPLDPDAVRWANAVRANGSTVSIARLAIVSAFLIAEKASGAWSLTDDYWGLWGETAAQALTSLKQCRLASAVNAPTFLADRHYAFDAATNYLNTGFIPATHGVAYTGNVQRLAAYERVNVSSSGAAAGARVGSSNSISLVPRNGAFMNGAVNHTAGSSSMTLALADSRGLKAISRNGGTTALGYDRGVRLADATGLTIGSTSAPAVPLFIGAFNSSNTPITLRAASNGFVAIGGPRSDAQELAQYNAVQAWATAIGANV
jgi:hypothetical protein